MYMYVQVYERIWFAVEGGGRLISCACGPGPCGQGSCGPPWALGGFPGPFRSGPLWGPMWAALRPLWVALGPWWASLGPCSPPGMNHERNASRFSGEAETLNAAHETD